MLPLDAKSIVKIKSILSKIGHCPLFALEYKKQSEVIVTNGTILFSWPKKLVVDCPQYNKLLDAQKDPVAVGAVDKFGHKHWVELLFDPEGKFMKAIEQDLTDEEAAEQKRQETLNPKNASERYVVYTTTRGVMRVRYNWAMLEVTEYLIECPTYQVFRLPKSETHSQVLQMMGVCEDGKMVGAFANMVY